MNRRSLPIGLIITGIVLILSLIAYFANPRITTAVLNSTLRQSTPLVLGALCGLIGERAGIINIGIEGQMLFGAFVGFYINVWTGNLLLAVVGAIAAGAVTGLLLAYMSVTLKMDQIIGGTVLNILAFGLTGYFYVQGAVTKGRFTPIEIPLLSQIPLIGDVFFSNGPLTYLSLLLVAVTHYVLFYTVWGLRTRAVGEKPRAADTLGINVFRVRYINVIIGGALAGLAGGYLTLEAVGSFERAMTNGRGFIALAVMIFGKWTPLGSWGAALLFGFFYAIQTQLNFLLSQEQYSYLPEIPQQFIGMLPYLLTIAVLAGLIGRSRPPAAEGIPYEKE